MIEQTLVLQDAERMRFTETEHVQIQSLTWKTTQSGNITQGYAI